MGVTNCPAQARLQRHRLGSPETLWHFGFAILVMLWSGTGSESFSPGILTCFSSSTKLPTAKSSLMPRNLFGDENDDKEKGKKDMFLKRGDDSVLEAAFEAASQDMQSKAGDFFTKLREKKAEPKGQKVDPMPKNPKEEKEEDSSQNPQGEDEKDTVSYSCRIVTAADAKLSTKKSLLPDSLDRSPYLLDKLDAIYHAMAHKQTRSLAYMERAEALRNKNGEEVPPETSPLSTETREEEEQIISILKESLQDAGFQMLTRRDLDLVQALNADYLLRLSIMADVSQLDKSIVQEFFPGRFNVYKNGTVETKEGEDFLYDGRVLVFWRGYGYEVNRGRLLLPKIDYLQASIVQKAASLVREQLNALEEIVSGKTSKLYDKASTKSLSVVAKSLESIPSRRVADKATAKLDELAKKAQGQAKDEANKKDDEKLFKLTRYGGYRKSFTSSPNPSDALTPFTICEVDRGAYDVTGSNVTETPEARPARSGNITSDGMSLLNAEMVDHDLYQAMNQAHFTCLYDEEMTSAMGTDPNQIPTMQLLERVSIRNLVDFTESGRKNLVSRILAKNTLMEPTYEEVSGYCWPEPLALK